MERPRKIFMDYFQFRRGNCQSVGHPVDSNCHRILTADDRIPDRVIERSMEKPAVGGHAFHRALRRAGHPPVIDVRNRLATRSPGSGVISATGSSGRDGPKSAATSGDRALRVSRTRKPPSPVPWKRSPSATPSIFNPPGEFEFGYTLFCGTREQYVLDRPLYENSTTGRI